MIVLDICAKLKYFILLIMYVYIYEKKVGIGIYFGYKEIL